MTRRILRTVLTSLNIVLALFVFQNGFLLKRQEIQSKSSCTDVKSGDQNYCWIKPQYERIIVILVDALRYDFLLPPTEDIEEDEKYYRGQMKHVGELISSKKAIVGTLLADPPTTTLQRLKAMTTGTLPTFIDAGDNFSPNASVNEDSFLYQARQQNRSMTLLGDDTWLSLYPTVFTRTSAYDSFDIYDLNSVDDRVKPILEQEIKSSNSSVIIAHFLTVDHCGHKFGPKHPAMGDSLRRVDEVIGKTAKNMKNRDLLIVIGDHGMTSTGDHGGESDSEIKAGILVYTKMGKIGLPSYPMHQIDIVPTISLLLGLPIPFSSLGTVIVEMFPKHLRESVVAMNYEQIKRFAETYATMKGFTELHAHIAREANSMEEQLSFMYRIQTVLRTAWTQFDDSYINVGMLALIEASMFLASNEVMSIEWTIFRSGCAFLQSALLYDKTESNSLPQALLIMSLSLACLSSLKTIFFQILTFRWDTWRFGSKHFGILAVLAHCLSLFSNSFVVYEAVVTRYLLQSVMIVAFLEKLRSWPSAKKPLKFKTLFNSLWENEEFMVFFVSLACLRSEKFFHRCREEEVRCTDSYAATAAASLSPDARVIRLIIAAASVFALNSHLFHLKREALQKSTKLRILHMLSWGILFMLIIHSSLQNTFASKANFLAQTIFASSIICAAVAFTDKNNGIWFGLTFLVIPFHLLLGDGMQPAIAIFIVFVHSVFILVPNETLPSVITLMVSFGFYLTGHSPVISSIPWTAAFVGVPGSLAWRIFPAFLVLLHLNISAVAGVFMITKEITAARSTLALMTTYGAFLCFASSLHRRHLMVWKIFAPKFIFDGLLLVTFIIVFNVLIISHSAYSLYRSKRRT